MSTAFDPYYTWLGIPPAEQPPDYYRLLGVVRFEPDPTVIAYASDRQMAHLRSLQMGPQAEASQRLLNEVAAARVCLLDPAQKAAYDAQLQERSLATGPADGAEQAFDQFILIDKLDASRSGQVLKARHATMGRIVALKILSREAMASAQFRERFQRKVRILAQLQHPNLVAAYEAGEFQGMCYLVMEYVEGQDLRSIVKQWGPPPVDKALDYIGQAAEGLAYAHRQGVFHRDVKPANFLVDNRGLLKVVGLGLAHVEPDSVLSEEGMGDLTRQGQIMGTYDYMSPEQAVDSSRVDPRCDIYSLGCSLYAILTGRPPYLGSSPMQQVAAHREAPIPSLRAARPDVPAFLDAVFQRMVAKRPEDRFQSMDEVLAALRGGIAPAVMPVIPGTAPAVVPFDAASPPAVLPVGPAPAFDAPPAVTLVADGSGLDFLAQAKPATTGAKPGAPRPARPKGWSAILHNPVIRFYLLGSLVLLVVVGVLLYLSNKPPARRATRKPAAETTTAEPGEARPEEKAVAADSTPAPSPAKAEEPKFTTGKPTFIGTDPPGATTAPAKGKPEPASTPTFLETDPLGTMTAPAKGKPEPASKPTFLETDPLGTMIGGNPAPVVDDKPASLGPDPFAPKPAAPKAKPALKQPTKAKPAAAAAKPAVKQPPQAKPGAAKPPAAAKPAPGAESKIDSPPAPSSPKKAP